VPRRAVAGGVFGKDLLERHEVAGRKVVETAADRSERVLVREDLGGLLQRLVLIDRNPGPRRGDPVE
jgi:hypothetical protein